MSISKAYESTDQAILTHSPDLGRGGSTAVTAILINNQKLWVANVGDSRAVLSRGGVAVQMSTDHEPNTERGSIENRGGFVSNMPGSSINTEIHVLFLLDDHCRFIYFIVSFRIEIDTSSFVCYIRRCGKSEWPACGFSSIWRQKPQNTFAI
jgi:serine/threonine protein phosphatase PrpC